MIFEWRREDDDYHEWFAWRPVMLYGPDEWDRVKMLRAYPRLVWLRTVLRWRNRPRTYYALPWRS
jgi:hypothetical protein